MDPKVLKLTAAGVECSEAIGWEIVQIAFDSLEDEPDEANRKSPYLMLSVNFEFDDRVQLEYHDGEDYGGDWLGCVDLWRDRVVVHAKSGREFVVGFDLTEGRFNELREYLRVLLRRDCFRGP